MSADDYHWTERGIRRVLTKLAKQRVALILQPGGVWVIERAIEDNERTDAALRTCHMRGWIEVLDNAVPTGALLPDGSLPPGNPFRGSRPLYRLTEGGWDIVRRSHLWSIIAIAISVLSFAVSVMSLVAAFPAFHHGT